MEKEAKQRNAPVYKFKSSSQFRMLVSAILSTRTRDELTLKAVRKLFRRFKNIESISKASENDIVKLIYPVGFYKTKAKLLIKLAKILKYRYNYKIPDNKKDLLLLPGVGEKVANIVLSYIFNKNVIAVDTHVHRISNRLGLVRTKTFKQTQEKLLKIVPKDLRKKLNKVFVAYGQTICLPKNPKCLECKLKDRCKYFQNRILD